MSAHSVTTAAYLLERAGASPSEVALSIAWLLQKFVVVATSTRLLKTALQSQIIDYEDAVIEQAALKAAASLIVTRNMQGFVNSAVKALTPEMYLAKASF